MEVGLLVDSLHTQLGLPPAAADHLLLLLGGDPGLTIHQDTFVTSSLGWWAGREEDLVGKGLWAKRRWLGSRGVYEQRQVKQDVNTQSLQVCASISISRSKRKHI